MDPGKAEPTSHQGETNKWFTPDWIMGDLGYFDLDPCGDMRWQLAGKTFTENGLEQNWFGRVWMNPPYGRNVNLWTEKFAAHGNGIALLFARTDTKWFQALAPKCSWLFFIAGRVKFVNSKTLQETKQNPGAPSVLMAMGEQPRPNYIKGFITYN